MIDVSKFQTIASAWPKDGLESVPHCPVCGSDRRHLLYKGLTDRTFFCAPGEWALYQCIDCGCGCLDPRPTPETIHLAYRRYYTHTPHHKVDTEVLHRLRRIQRALANGYRNWRFGTRLSPASKLGVVAAWLMPAQRQALEREFRHLPRPARNARLLDVGFGNDVFLELARSAGWLVSGADPDPLAVDAVRKKSLDARRGGVEAFTDMPGSFDVITLCHVIEHMHDPRGAITQIYQLLKPGGYVWIDTPNISSFGHRHFGRNWMGLDPPRHLVLFNWDALASTLREEGFSRIKRLTHYNAYPNLATPSRAIADGRDPYENPVSRLSDRIYGSLLGFRTQLDYRRSEVVTLKAFKPVAGGRFK